MLRSPADSGQAPRAQRAAAPATAAVAAPPASDPGLPLALLAGFETPYSERLCALLRASGRLDVIATAVPRHITGPAIELHRPKVALVCDEALDTVELALLARQHPETGIIVVARRLSEARARVLDRLGAAAMLQRDIDRLQLVMLTIAVALGMRGGAHMTQTSLVACADPRLARLSTHESVVLELLKEHRQLGEIAAALGVSVETIRSQTKSINRKLGVSSRQELRTLLRSLERPASSNGSG